MEWIRKIKKQHWKKSKRAANDAAHSVPVGESFTPLTDANPGGHLDQNGSDLFTQSIKQSANGTIHKTSQTQSSWVVQADATRVSKPGTPSYVKQGATPTFDQHSKHAGQHKQSADFFSPLPTPSSSENHSQIPKVTTSLPGLTLPPLPVQQQQEEITAATPLRPEELRVSSVASMPPLEPYPKRDHRFWRSKDKAGKAAWVDKAQERLELADSQVMQLQAQLSAANTARWQAEQQLVTLQRSNSELRRMGSWQSTQSTVPSSLAPSEAGGSGYTTPTLPRRTHSDSEMVVHAVAERVKLAHHRSGNATPDSSAGGLHQGRTSHRTSDVMRQLAKYKREVENYEAMCKTFGDVLRDYELVQHVKLVSGSLHYGRLRDAMVDLWEGGRAKSVLPVLAMSLAFGPDEVHRVRGVLAAARQEAQVVDLEPKVLKTNMDVAMKAEAVAACERACNLFVEDRKISDYIGSHFNAKYASGLWQCVVGESFGLALCGEGKEIQMKSGQRSILLWSTAPVVIESSHRSPNSTTSTTSGPHTPEPSVREKTLADGLTELVAIEPVRSRPVPASSSGGSPSSSHLS